MSTFPEPSPIRDEPNPFAAPQAEVGGYVPPADAELADAEAIRRQFLTHEASVKGVGLLFYLNTFFTFALGVFFLYNAATGQDLGPDGYGTGLLLLAMSIGVGFLGRGLRRLRPWARTVTMILTVLWIILNVAPILLVGAVGSVFPLIISIYILALMASSKNQTVFSPAYQDVIAKTPHVKYRTHFLVKALGVILLVVIVFGLVAVLVAGRR